MAIVIELYNSTAADIPIADVPTPFTVPKNNSAIATTGNTRDDLINSMTLRQHTLLRHLQFFLNGQQIDLAGILGMDLKETQNAPNV